MAEIAKRASHFIESPRLSNRKRQKTSFNP